MFISIELKLTCQTKLFCRKMEACSAASSALTVYPENQQAGVKAVLQDRFPLRARDCSMTVRAREVFTQDLLGCRAAGQNRLVLNGSHQSTGCIRSRWEMPGSFTQRCTGSGVRVCMDHRKRRERKNRD